MRSREIPLAVYAELEDVVRARLAIPTDRELAEKHHISRGYIRQLLYRIRKQLGNNGYVSRGAIVCDTEAIRESNLVAHVETDNR